MSLTDSFLPPNDDDIRKPSVSPASWFSLDAQDHNARAGTLQLASGVVETPAFMAVGTQASVKALDTRDLNELGAQIVLANTYHLMLRPGGALLEEMGGVSRFMGWHRPVLTDSGGFQVFSLARNRILTDAGVVFRSHLDGREHRLTPEDSIQLQLQFGSDIVMALDVCSGYDASEAEHQRADELTHAWLPRNIEAFRHVTNQSDMNRSRLFGICQGGFEERARAASARLIGDSSVDGCAIGGLSVGEPKAVLAEMLTASVSQLPADRPRYLMGVGSPEDLWNCVALGVDMFDCVLPTRVARHGAVYTPFGRVNLRAARNRMRDEPIDPACDCYACRTVSAAYLHHLFRTGELSAYRLATIHNLRFVIRQTELMRAAIRAGRFADAHQQFLADYEPVDERVAAAQRGRYRAAGEAQRS